MSTLKSYVVLVKTSAESYGTVEATSLDEAKQLAKDAFDEGDLTQCGKEIEAVVAFTARKRTGSWSTFERRFQPINGPEGAPYWHRDQLPNDIDERLVWTIVDCDGRLYVTPGFRLVNRIDYVFCRLPWSEEDQHQPDYRYD